MDNQNLTQLVRITVTIRPDQDIALRKCADETGASISWQIRELLDAAAARNEQCAHDSARIKS